MTHFRNTVARVFLRFAQAAAVLCVLLFVAVLAVLFFGGSQLARLQHTLRPRAESELRALIGRDVRIGSVTIQGLNQLVFHDLAIADGKTFAGGTAATAKNTRADFNLLSLILHRNQNPVDAIDRITVNTPNLAISRASDGRWNFQDILDRLNAAQAGSALRARVVVADGQVTLHDARGFGIQEAPMTQRLVGVRGTLSSRGGGNYSFLVSARGASSRMGAVMLAGNYSGDDGSTRINVSADDIAVNAVAKFLPANLPITFENGTAALRLSALFTNLPAPNRTISTDTLTAEVDLSGVGLRLHEMSSPIMATSGRLRLVHDRERYPRGSRLEFINVRARAGQIPLTLAGKLTDLNLFDLTHAQPQVALTLTASGQGPQFQQLFPETKWLQDVTISGKTKLVAEVTGKSTDLRIDGTLENEHTEISGLRLDGAATAFRLAPGVATAGERSSLILSARVRHANLGESEYQNLQLALTSATPWNALAKDPLLNGTASVGEARMPWGAAKNIRGKMTVTRSGVRFDEIRAGLFGGEVAAGPLLVPLDAMPGGIVLDAKGSYRDIDLAQLTRALNVKDLSGTGEGTFALTLDNEENLRFATDLSAEGIVYQDKRVDRITTTLRVAARDGAVSIAIPNADAQTEYGHFTVADGSFRRDDRAGSGALRLPVRGDMVNLQKFYAKLTGEAELTGTVQGDISAPVLVAHAIARDGALLGREFTQAESDLEYSGANLRLRNIVFTRDGMTGRVVDDGKGLDPRKSLVGLVATLELHGASVDNITSLFEAESPWRIDGGAFGTVDVRYTDEGIVLGGQATIADAIVQVPVADGEYPLELDRLGLTFTYADRKMQIQDLALERNASTIHGRGTAESPLGGRLRVDADFTGIQARLEDMPLDLFNIPIPLHGEAQIAGALHGVLDGSGPEPMTADVSVTAPRFAAAGVPMRDGSVDLQYRYHHDARELIVRRGVAGGVFSAEGSGHFYLDRQRMKNVRLAIHDIDLTRLIAMMSESDLPFALALPDGSSGHGRIELTADGSYAQPALTLGFNLDRLALAGTSLPDLRGQLRGQPVDGHYRLRVDELAAASAGVNLARVAGDIEPGRNVDLRVVAGNLTAKALAPWLPDLPFDGKLDFTGVLRGPWQNPALDGDLQLADLRYEDRAIPRASGHIRLDASQLKLSDGQIQLLVDGQPVRVSGQAPVRWENFQPSLRQDRPLSLAIDLPQQELAALRPLLPSMVTSLTGSVEGGLRVTGTAAQPRFDEGWLEVRGNAGFNLGNPGFADSLQNIDLRASIAGDPRRSIVTIERLTADIGRKKDPPGSLDAAGTVSIAGENLLMPQHWQWDLYAAVDKLPLPAELMVAPKASGALHLVSKGATPVLEGVMLLEHIKLKEPKMVAGDGGWGPFSFDPRLSIAVQVGDGVKMSKSIFSVPLRRTPLAYPGLSLQPDGMPLPVLAMISYDEMIRNAGTADEMTGTWGTITGTLNEPQVYARFEVNKGKLSFPLNLIGSVRHARGHVTYTRAGGPQIVMGIPDFPTKEAKTPPSPTPTPALGLR